MNCFFTFGLNVTSKEKLLINYSNDIILLNVIQKCNVFDREFDIAWK